MFLALGCEDHQKIDAEREEEMKMSVKWFGGLAGKAAIAGFAMAVLTAGAAPAKAAKVTWNLWIAYDDALLAEGLEGSLTGHGVKQSATDVFGITQATEATGFVTFDDSGCGSAFCGPLEDPHFAFEFGFDGTVVSFSDNSDDFRFNGTSYVDSTNLGVGPAMQWSPFFGAIGPDINVPFAHNSSSDNWVLRLIPGAVEIYDLRDPSVGFLNWTAVRGTLCHDGFGEPGQDSVCYRGPDTGVVPIPAALPLFASGLVAMGLGAWRRRRNA